MCNLQLVQLFVIRVLRSVSHVHVIAASTVLCSVSLVHVHVIAAYLICTSSHYLIDFVPLHFILNYLFVPLHFISKYAKIVVLSSVHFFCISFFVGSRVSTCNSFEMRVDHVTIWVHADGAHEDEPHADEFE